MTTDREAWLSLPVAPEPTEARPRISGWTAAEKLAILTEYESYPRGDPRRGALLRRSGALLRRSGAYTSHISKWRKQRDRGALARLAPQPRDPLHDEVERRRTENARLQERLEKAA